ncbi:hypothetical protein AALC75_18200 [Lachnospiraceae bacterium 48-42]
MKELMNLKNMHKYDDIIDLPHHVSKTHPQMPAADRAAQFAPFAALAGHHESVKEAARLTEEMAELDELVKAEINEKLQNIQKNLSQKPEVSITYFVPDARKEGGSYVTVTGGVKKVDTYKKILILTDGTYIPIDKIAGIEGTGHF